jgi:hypothetical protein
LPRPIIPNFIFVLSGDSTAETAEDADPDFDDDNADVSIDYI